MIPKKLFFTAGTGKSKDRLISFELALKDAQINHCNIVQISSIIPKDCEIIDVDDGLTEIMPGEIVYGVMARIDTDKDDQQIAASIGMVRPSDLSHHGYLSTFQGHDYDDSFALTEAQFLAAHMFDKTFGYDDDIIMDAIAASSTGEKDLFTTVVAVAIFII